jgi:hypothetical protein
METGLRAILAGEIAAAAETVIEILSRSAASF